MGNKIVAIIGSYRKDGITEQTVDAILKAAIEKGSEARKIHLINKHIEFCANCRKCTQDGQGKKRGVCIIKDDMNMLLSEIDSADALVLASPINFGNVTAVMKKFIERLIVYTYWPWGKMIPKNRINNHTKKAVIVTSSSSPAFIGKLFMPSAQESLRASAQVLGAKVVKSVYFGGVCNEERQLLKPKQLTLAQKAGMVLL